MKKVTCKEFFATFFGGIWQAILWVIGLFGYKEGSSFGKFLKRVFAVCATFLVVVYTCVLLYVLVVQVVYEKGIKPRTEYYIVEEAQMSDRIVFQRNNYTYEGRIYDADKEKVILEDVDWVAVADKDPLAVFAKGGKRGYLNRFTGEVVVPEIYNRAWIFSDGLAAVEKEGELLFIDHSGKVVIDKDFQVCGENPVYVFENGYCKIINPIDGKVGLIDKKGNWALTAEYDGLFNNEGFWQVEKDCRVGLFTAEMEVMFPIENTHISIHDSIIEVRRPDHTAKRYDYAGNILVDFVIDEVSNLYYEKMDQDVILDPIGEEIPGKTYRAANSRCYMVEGGCWDTYYYGLMDRRGKIITPPIYTDIQAIDKDLYLCQPDGIIIDDRGKIVK